MENEIMCINQLFRPKEHIHMYGVGNCTICEPNEDNSNCKNYYPVNVVVINGDSTYENTL